ncbi:MAG: hypothetical protein GYA56_00915 [Geobacteraceae bacterium]|nr:hypothetical protein [Geobacteraceae bacterium]
MKTFLKTLSLSLVLVMALGAGAQSRAEEATAGQPAAPAEAAKPAGKVIPEDLTADFNLSLYSQYIWRGYELSRGSVVFFPTMTVGYKGFAVNLWADLDTRFAGSDNHGKFRLQETDVTLSYSNSYEPWKLNYTLGWILYNYQPGQNQELFLSLGLDTLLKPTFTVYNEIEIGQAWYFNLGVSHSFPIYKDWSLDVGGWVSYLHDKSDADFSNFHDGNISAGVKIPINNYISIKPNIQYSFPLSGEASHEIRSLSFSGHSQFVYGGIIFDLAL